MLFLITKKGLFCAIIFLLFFYCNTFVFAQQTLESAIPAPEAAPALTQAELQRWAGGGGGVQTPRVNGLQSFQPLAGIPGLPASADLGVLINAAYKLAIALGALIAVFQITLAGFKYLASPGNFSTTEEAKEDIRNSLLGLLILLSTVLILETIFGQVNLNPIASAPNVRTEGSGLNPGGSLSSVDASVKNELGCNQTGGSTNRTCSSGTSAVISGGRVQCSTASGGHQPGMMFQPVLQADCERAGVGESIIRNGGTLQGMHVATLGMMGEELKKLDPNFDPIQVSPEDIRSQYIEQVLTPACGSETGNNPSASIQVAGSAATLCDGRSWSGYASCGGRASTNNTEMRFHCSTPQ